eukprot:5365509-Lingulodinium_polyedra.AAC.1
MRAATSPCCAFHARAVRAPRKRCARGAMCAASKRRGACLSISLQSLTSRIARASFARRASGTRVVRARNVRS